MNRHNTKYLVAAGLVLMLIIIRGPVLKLYIQHKTNRLEKKYSLQVNFDKLRIKGLSTISFYKLSVNQTGRDTLFSARNLRLRLNPVKLLFLSPDLRQADADEITFTFSKKDTLSNFDFLFRRNSSGRSSSDTLKTGYTQSGHNYARNIQRYFSLTSGLLPSTANIKHVGIKYLSNNYLLDISTAGFQVKNKSFSTVVLVNENGIKSSLHISGKPGDSGKFFSAQIYPDDIRKFSLPFLDFKWGAKADFDTLSLDISGPSWKGDHITLTGKAQSEGLSIYHKKLSSENVVLEKGSFDYKLNIGRDYFELDSSSVIKMNNLTISPYIKALKKRQWRIIASLNKKEFNSDDLFSSLPKGLFYNLDGLKTSGKLSYHFFFDIDFSNIDSLKFESSLSPENFRIREFGRTDFRKINNDFEYTAYEREVPVRSFNVGPSYRNFRSLDKISPYLQMAVLQSEDGGFFYHRGFLPESIRESLAQDIKERRFHRGGSTISMQLVKNVFLSRNKTLARKFEEAMIVWLIETNRLSSKERMFEVYLNIIEWGPGIYGIGEASRFYFDKEPKDLSVNESIFLAEIIPAPKWSLNLFTDDFHLKPGQEEYFKLLARRLCIKGLITEAQETDVRPDIQLAGEARTAIIKRIKLNPESETLIEENQESE